MISLKQEKLTVLHIGTLNQPIGQNLGYGPIETVIHNIDIEVYVRLSAI